MENTVSGTNFMLCMDERLNVEEQPLYVGYKGASSLVLRKQSITGSIADANGNLHFDITPPARCVVDKRVFLDLKATFNFAILDNAGNAVDNGADDQIFGPYLTVGGDSIVNNQTDALKFLPFQQCCNSVNVQINGTSITENVGTYIEALSRCGWNDDWINHDGSITPLMHDTFHDYAAATGGNAPLLSYDGAQNTRYMPRGHVIMRRTAGDVDASNVATVEVEWSEPVLLPLLGHSQDEKGFIGINQLNLEFNYQNLYRMWASSNPKLVGPEGGAARRSTITCTLSQANLRMTYLVPPENLALPEVNKYPYYGMTRYISGGYDLPTVGPSVAATQDFTLSNINLKGIPSRIFLWVQPSAQVKNQGAGAANNLLASWAIPDTYAVIDSINMDFNGRSAVLTDANSYDLYRMSVKDVKLDMTYPQFRFATGSVIGLSPFSLPLDSLQCSGSRGNVDFQLKVKAKNCSTKLNGASFQLYCVVVDEGVWTVAGSGPAYLEITDVSPVNVLEGKYITYSNRLTPGELSGGQFGFLRKAARGIGKAIDWAARNAPKAIQAVKTGVQLAEKYAPQAMGVAARVAPLLMGLGYSQSEVDDIMAKKTGAGPWVGAGSEAGFPGDMSASGLKAVGGRASRKSFKK